MVLFDVWPSTGSVLKVITLVVFVSRVNDLKAYCREQAEEQDVTILLDPDLIKRV